MRRVIAPLVFCVFAVWGLGIVAAVGQVVVSPATVTVTTAASTVLDDATVAAMVDTLGGATATGTGGLVRATSPTIGTSFDMEAAGVRFSAADGILTLLGLGNGADENLTLDLDNGGSNVITIASGTAAASLVLTGIAITAPTVTARHVTSGTTPTVANVGANSCGTTAATIAGNSNSFEITVGATAGTQCRVTFPTAAPVRWNCDGNNDTTVANLVSARFVDTLNVDIFGTFVAGDLVTVQCFPR